MGGRGGKVKTKTLPVGPRRASQAGFTFLVVLVAVAALAIGAQVAIPLVSRAMQADREQELLFRGMAYRRAIGSYYEAAVAAGRLEKTYPQRLEDLLQDPRFVHRRHLRELYPHPLDERGWVLIRGPGGGIAGVASPSERRPLKRASFEVGLELFENAETYRQWEFVYLPGAPAGTAGFTQRLAANHHRQPGQCVQLIADGQPRRHRGAA